VRRLAEDNHPKITTTKPMIEETIHTALTRPYNKSPRRDGHWPSFQTRTRKCTVGEYSESITCSDIIAAFSAILGDIEEIKEGVFKQERASDKFVYCSDNNGQSVQKESKHHIQSVLYWKLCDFVTNLKLLIVEDKTKRGNSEEQQHIRFLFDNIRDLLFRLHSIRESIRQSDLHAGCIDEENSYSDLYWLVNDITADLDDRFEIQIYMAGHSRFNR